jgi:hypothetical protein
MIAQYRKKPVVIEAVQYTGNPGSVSEIRKFVGDDLGFKTNGPYIRTLEGEMTIMLGDYVIKGVNGEFYPCKPDIFEKTYEAVDDPSV